MIALKDLPWDGSFKLPNAKEIWQKIVELPLGPHDRENVRACQCMCIKEGTTYEKGVAMPFLVQWDIVPVEKTGKAID